MGRTARTTTSTILVVAEDDRPSALEIPPAQEVVSSVVVLYSFFNRSLAPSFPTSILPSFHTSFPPSPYQAQSKQ